MAGKRLILTKHAAEMLIERKMPLALLERMVEKGAKFEDMVSRATLCVYKEKAGKYYTLVLDDDEKQITVITGYESSKWQIEQCRKVKRK